jgi:hypothetical protein
MHFEPKDRCPIMDFGFWDETLPIWEDQGYPKGANSDDFFGMDPQWITAPVNVDLCPSFDYEMIEDKGDTEIIRDGSGVIVERGKFLGSIPRHIEHTLKDRKSWEAEFEGRLEAGSPARLPKNWDELVRTYNDPARDYPIGVPAGSLFGRIRDWMGLEGVSLIAYDDPELFVEMVRSMADCVVGTLARVLDSGVRFEYASMWEDMCYRSGPLISPALFQKVLVPQYRRITSILNDYGIDVVILDCDGDTSKLMPLWLDSGVSTMFPIEVGVWNTDPVAVRQKFGRRVRMVGGVSKRILASTFGQITAEVERLAPVVEEGGYIPTPDHRVPPDVSLTNYLHYIREARRIWGHDLPNLRPMAGVSK